MHKKTLPTKKKKKYREGKSYSSEFFIILHIDHKSLLWLSVQGKCDFEEEVPLHFSALLGAQMVVCNYVRRAGTAQQLVAYLERRVICPQLPKPSIILH